MRLELRKNGVLLSAVASKAHGVDQIKKLAKGPLIDPGDILEVILVTKRGTERCLYRAKAYDNHRTRSLRTC